MDAADADGKTVSMSRCQMFAKALGFQAPVKYRETLRTIQATRAAEERVAA